MKGFETKNGVTSSTVDNWTLQQCVEYIEKYPKGLKAEQAKRRIKELQPGTKKSKSYNNQHSANVNKQPEVIKKDAPMHQGESNDKICAGAVLGIICVIVIGIVIFVLSINLSEYLAAIIPGGMCVLYAIYRIGNKLFK